MTKKNKILVTGGSGRFGEILKKRLLTKFKSIKNIKSAGIKELMTVEGINEKIAKKILDKFKND